MTINNLIKKNINKNNLITKFKKKNARRNVQKH